MEPVLKSELAKRLRVTKGRISQMISMGMPVRPDGKIDVSAALGWVEEHIDPSHKDAVARRQANASDVRPPVTSTTSSTTFPPVSGTGLPDAGKILLSAKAKRALVELRRAEREERKESGELIEVEEVARVVEDLVLNARNKLLSLGFRLAPGLAIETDAARCRQMIDDAVVETLREISEYRVA